MFNIKIPNPLESLKQKYIEIGRKQGYEEGYKYGEANGFSKGYIKAINEENKRHKSSTKQNSEPTVDDLMLWFKSLTEILGTKYFSSIVCGNDKSETIAEVLKYLDYFEHNHETKIYYPEVKYHLPELKKAFQQIYENKLAVEEAERLI